MIIMALVPLSGLPLLGQSDSPTLVLSDGGLVSSLSSHAPSAASLISDLKPFRRTCRSGVVTTPLIVFLGTVSPQVDLLDCYYGYN